MMLQTRIRPIKVFSLRRIPIVMVTKSGSSRQAKTKSRRNPETRFDFKWVNKSRCDCPECETSDLQVLKSPLTIWDNFNKARLKGPRYGPNLTIANKRRIKSGRPTTPSLNSGSPTPFIS